MIQRETIERIKQAADIEKVVANYVQLRKRGVNYVGLCPFHQDTRPSLSVSPSKGIWKCFACGEGGNAIDFVMKHEHASYPEALRILAKQFGIEIEEKPLTPKQQAAQSKRERLRTANEWACEKLESLLLGSPAAQYMAERGIPEEVLKTFRIGYDDGTLYKYGYSPEVLAEAGLVIEGRDRFEGRVTFPFRDLSGMVTGYTSRTLDKRTKGVSQKYVNSPDSELFHKGRSLYGLYEARPAIIAADSVYVVEGNMDVLQLHAKGIANVVAASGTALTQEQAHLLHRFAKKVILMMDGDDAGRHAMMKAGDVLLAENVELRVVTFPDGEDPDSYAFAHTSEELRAYLEEKEQDYIQYRLSLIGEIRDSPTKRAQETMQLMTTIALIPDPILREEYISICSQELSIARSKLREVLQAAASKGGGKVMPLSLAYMTSSELAHSPEAVLLRLALIYGDRKVLYKDGGQATETTVAQLIHADIAADGLEFENPVYWSIFQELVSIHTQHKPALYFANHEDNLVALSARALMQDFTLDAEPEIDDDTLRGKVQYALANFKYAYLDGRRRELLHRIFETSSQEEVEALKRQFSDIMKLMKAYHNYRTRGELAI